MLKHHDTKFQSRVKLRGSTFMLSLEMTLQSGLVSRREADQTTDDNNGWRGQLRLMTNDEWQRNNFWQSSWEFKLGNTRQSQGKQNTAISNVLSPKLIDSDLFGSWMDACLVEYCCNRFKLTELKSDFAFTLSIWKQIFNLGPEIIIRSHRLSFNDKHLIFFRFLPTKQWNTYIYQPITESHNTKYLQQVRVQVATCLL